MENLYNRLYELLMQELDDLSIGYPANKARMEEMNDLVHHIHVSSCNAISRPSWAEAYHKALYAPVDFGVVSPISTYEEEQLLGLI